MSGKDYSAVQSINVVNIKKNMHLSYLDQKEESTDKPIFIVTDRHYKYMYMYMYMYSTWHKKS